MQPVKNTYMIEDLMVLLVVEDTLNSFNKLFSIDGLLPASFVTKYKVEPIRTEACKTGRGYRRIYSAKVIIELAQSMGLLIEKAKDRLESENQIDTLKSEINRLDILLLQKQFALQKINKAIEQSFRRYQLQIDDPLLDENEILLMAGVRKKKCGIYFLIKNDAIVYVGQSTNIFNRVGDHEGVKDFDRFTYVECEKNDLTILETKYINNFKPKYNFDSNGRLCLPTSLKNLYVVEKGLNHATA